MTSRRGGEDGFTISELMVSITLLALALFGVASVFNSSFDMTAASSNRGLAEALASQDTEALRAMPYAQLGYIAPPAGTFENHPYVAVTQGGVSQTTSQTRGSVAFTVTRHIVWMDVPNPLPAATPDAACTDPSICFPQAYKRTTVIVSWSEKSPKSVRQDSNVYPSGRGTYVAGNGAQTGTSNLVFAPTSLVATPPPGGGDGSARIDLAWESPAVADPKGATWVVEWTLDSTFMPGRTNRVTETFPVTATPTAATVYFAVTGLSPAASPATPPYRFRVFSLAGDRVTASTPSNTAARSTTSVSTTPACGLGTVSVSTPGIRRASATGAALATAPYLVVNTNGGCAGTQLRVSFRPAIGASVVTHTLTAEPQTHVYTRSISAAGDVSGSGWDLGQHIFSVAMGPTTSEIVVSKPVLTVCAAGTGPCP